MVEIRIIDREHKGDINLKNQPFPLFGRLLPEYINGEWSSKTALFENDEISEMCFPDENYNYDEMAENSIFIGAYDSNQCVGLAILQQAFFKYMYLYDLKVDSACRGQHIGRMLIEKAKEIAAENGYRGIYTQGQDNNLAACLFYLNCGFVIGGLDTMVYRGTPQQDKKDILFYLDI